MSDELAEKMLIGAGLAGLGYYLWSGYSERQDFHQQLREALGEVGLQLVNADVGRTAVGEPVWYLTVQHQRLGVHSLRATLAPGLDPYSEESRCDLLKRLRSWILASAA